MKQVYDLGELVEHHNFGSLNTNFQHETRPSSTLVFRNSAVGLSSNAQVAWLQQGLVNRNALWFGRLLPGCLPVCLRGDKAICNKHKSVSDARLGMDVWESGQLPDVGYLPHWSSTSVPELWGTLHRGFMHYCFFVIILHSLSSTFRIGYTVIVVFIMRVRGWTTQIPRIAKRVSFKHELSKVLCPFQFLPGRASPISFRKRPPDIVESCIAGDLTHRSFQFFNLAKERWLPSFFAFCFGVGMPGRPCRLLFALLHLKKGETRNLSVLRRWNDFYDQWHNKTETLFWKPRMCETSETVLPGSSSLTWKLKKTLLHGD